MHLVEAMPLWRRLVEEPMLSKHLAAVLLR